MDINIEEMSEDDTFGAAKITDLTWKQLLDGDDVHGVRALSVAVPRVEHREAAVSEAPDHGHSATTSSSTGPQLLAAKQQGRRGVRKRRSQTLPAAEPRGRRGRGHLGLHDLWRVRAGVSGQHRAHRSHHRHAPQPRDGRVALPARDAERAAEHGDDRQPVGSASAGAHRVDARERRKQEPLEIPHISEAPDAEVLFWVGCAGAFDDRNKKVVYDFAKLMQIAGVKFAVLGPDENCNGDPARRMGAEYIYQMLAEQNIELLNEHKVKKIVTTCPHCFNTIFNEYPQFGGIFEVIHHTEYLAQLVKEGRLKPEGPTRQEGHVSRPLLQRASQRRVEGRARGHRSRSPAPSTRSCTATDTRRSAAAPAGAACGWKSAWARR